MVRMEEAGEVGWGGVSGSLWALLQQLGVRDEGAVQDLLVLRLG